MNDFEKIGSKMPYDVPEGFFENITSRTAQRIPQHGRNTRNGYALALALSAAVVALVLVFVIPSSDPTDYRNISECESIDEVMQEMSTADLEMWAMMTYPATERN